MIDVVLLTKNSAGEGFKHCLDAIKNEIPLNKLIVIDCFSTDETLQIIRDRFPDAKIIKSEALRGKAREIGINHVTTKWFAFVDSDVVLAENWFNELWKNYEVGIGALEGRMKRVYKQNPPEVEQFRRGLTACALILTEAVKDISIPEEMHNLEDEFIREYIEERNYRWLKIEFPVSKHLQSKRFGEDLGAVFHQGKMAGKYRLNPPLWKCIAVLIKLPWKTPLERKALIVQLLGKIRGLISRFWMMIT